MLLTLISDLLYPKPFFKKDHRMNTSESIHATPAQLTTSSSDQHSDNVRPSARRYMNEVYHWAYLNQRNVNRLDHEWVFQLLLFGNGWRMVRAYLDQISSGMRVWQVAHVYGDLIRKAAEKVGSNGQFDLTDVTQIQVQHAQQKMAHLSQAQVYHSDAAEWQNTDYDLVCSFFLLHEIPDDKKRAVVNRMLDAVTAHGKVIFIDYHRPAWWQPVGWLLRGVNAKLEPFSHALWQNDIKTYAVRAEEFVWHKRTIFGGVYQIVTAQLSNTENSRA